ncbi:C-factor-like [Oppia nitens]|uniref:C-factor-like n=1 Tax=Oppia nitens TaxID=1686743 RepID=UPI0023DA1DB6|nr:C-factor-like [Oppia nitens]
MSLQTVMITGANRGIGLELVRQLLAEPNPPKHLIATTRPTANRAELDALAAQHQNLHVLHMDSKLYDSFTAYTPTGIAAQVQQIVGARGLDTLINNAGVYITSPLDTVTANDMIENFEINTVSPLMLTKALLPQLKVASAERKTAVINISAYLGSIELTKPKPDGQWFSRYPYRCSKVALNMISQCLSIDLKRDNIYVISLHPGHLKTDMGGHRALTEVADGCNGIIKQIKLIDDSSNGRLVNYTGGILPW